MTANDFSSYLPYEGKRGRGNNLGFYGFHLTNQQLGLMAYNSGARTIRISLPDRSISGAGQTAELANVQYYDSIGLKDLTAFVGESNIPGQNGSGSGTPYNREKGTFPNTGGFSAKTFVGMYLPIWTDGTKTTVNPNNSLAVYISKVVATYGSYVKFYEIVNEPDFTQTGEGWDTNSAGYWGKIDPRPQDITNMLAPIQFYIRMLRVCYDVIKTKSPTSYVCTGGIGYPSFLDAICRNTDNPGATYTGFDTIASNITNGITYASYTGTGTIGSVTTDFPLKGGAYFDVVSFHDYPMYSLSYWDNSNGGSVRFHRESDYCVDTHINYKNSYSIALNKFNYNGTILPLKQWITTEVDVARSSVGSDWGSIDAQNNFIIKCHIFSDVNGIAQVYKYGMGDGGDSAANIFNNMGVYGLLTPSGTTPANAPKNPVYWRTKTLTDILYDSTYDPIKTATLNINKDNSTTTNTVRGAAYKNIDNTYTYVLWARITKFVTGSTTQWVTESETATTNFTFPSTFTGIRKEGDFSQTGTSTNVNGTVVALTGAPSFFIEEAPVSYTLGTIAVNGSITKSPDAGSYISGTIVSITAVPSNGYVFTGWSNDASGTSLTTTVTMTGNKSITANFVAITPTTYTLTTIATPTEGGTVTKNPNTSKYTSGTSVSLKATPKTGYNFTGWTGDASGTTNPLAITMSSNKTVTATFTKIVTTLQTITLLSNGTYILS